MDNDDLWEAFGDDDESSECEKEPYISEGVSFLIQQFIKHNPQIRVSQRYVLTTSLDWKTGLNERGIQTNEDKQFYDAVVLEEEDSAVDLIRLVIPGGHLLMVSRVFSDYKEHGLHENVWSSPIPVAKCGDFQLWAAQRVACPINSMACPWKADPAHPQQNSARAIDHELALLQKATITRSACELQHSTASLSPHGIEKAVDSLQKNGYCIIRSILDTEACCRWGKAVLTDFKTAAESLLKRDKIDLYHPQDSEQDPQTYRELSMREDLRIDIRDGPCMREERAREHHECERSPRNKEKLHGSAIISDLGQTSHKSCLRFHPSVIEIVQRTMNPTDDKLYKGNFGRFNFDGGGPDGSPQNLRIGPMGGIISLPGSADQAIHADTPHLFETIDCLPAHYINAFCLGKDALCATDEFGFSTGATRVGGTSFVHASHKLSFTSNLGDNWTAATEPGVLQNLVRPSLELGDLVLFDCRILHFGLANTTKSVERPLLYTNMTQAWFHDPKNWDDKKDVFDRNAWKA